MNLKKFKGKHITIFGLGRSGLAAARRLSLLGAKLFITEILPEQKFDRNTIEEIKKLGCKFELGGHTEKATAEAELIVMSPGIHLDLPPLEKVRERNIPIISEIELAYYFISKPIIAITGTNGKTTTTTLVGEMLKQAGFKVVVAGNIGYPLIAVDDSKLDYVVTEVSSYQLEGIKKFKPFIGGILNITEDHLERHANLENYAKIKSRIFENQDSTDYIVYNGDDPLVSKIVKEAKSNKIPFTRKNKFDIFKPEELKIKGEHNLENALAAVAISKICKVDSQTLKEALLSFEGVEHRIEVVDEINGITFINDSKATNANSTVVAIKAVSKEFKPKKIVLIAGGRDKGGSLLEMCNLVAEQVKAAVLIGEAAPRFAQALKEIGYKEIYRKNTFENAVQKAYQLSKFGDVVLLSPACASFDMFSNFEERGKVFKELVRNLKK